MIIISEEKQITIKQYLIDYPKEMELIQQIIGLESKNVLFRRFYSNFNNIFADIYIYDENGNKINIDPKMVIRNIENRCQFIQEGITTEFISDINNFIKKNKYYDLLVYLVEHNFISGFGKSKYSLHLSEYKKQTPKEIQQFLSNKYDIPHLIEDLTDANDIYFQLLILIEELYLKIKHIPEDNWDFIEHKEKSMIKIRNDFLKAKKYKKCFSSQYINTEIFQVDLQFDDKFKELMKLFNIIADYDLRIKISMVGDEYKFIIGEKMVKPITDELLQFLLSF